MLKVMVLQIFIPYKGMVFHKIPLILWYLVPFVHIKGKGLGICPDEMHVIVLGGGGGGQE